MMLITNKLFGTRKNFKVRCRTENEGAVRRIGVIAF